MLTPWIGYAIIFASLIAVVAAIADRLAFNCRVSRRFFWLAALVVSLAVPAILAVHGAPVHVAGATPVVAIWPTPNASLAKTTTLESTLLAARQDVGLVGRLRLGGILAAVEPRLPTLWLLTSLTLFVLFVGALLRLQRTRRRWREAELDGVRVLVAPETGPAVVGVLPPRIVLPAWAFSLDARARSLMLRHELEHVRARDPYMLMLAALSVLVVPWNVALWLIARRLKLAIEMDCDQRVLRASPDAHVYGLLLLEVGAGRTRYPPFGAALIERRTDLARRITAMLADKPRYAMVSSLLLVTCIALVTSAAVRLPRPEPMRFTRANAKPTAAEPGPRVTADWENAAIEDVVAAFARFAGKRITVARDVSASITAHIRNEPWDEALARVVSSYGYRLLIKPDSSMIVVSTSEPTRSPDRPGSVGRGSGEHEAAAPVAASASQSYRNRRVGGRVVDDSSNRPIGGAEVDVIGLQAIGGVNHACTSTDGRFQLVVPDGEVWLDARAPGYVFSRVTLAPSDSVAIFRGRRTTLVTEERFVSHALVRSWAPVQAASLFVIDGVIVSPAALVTEGSCAAH